MLSGQSDFVCRHSAPQTCLPSWTPASARSRHRRRVTCLEHATVRAHRREVVSASTRRRRLVHFTPSRCLATDIAHRLLRPFRALAVAVCCTASAPSCLPRRRDGPPELCSHQLAAAASTGRQRRASPPRTPRPFTRRVRLVPPLHRAGLREGERLLALLHRLLHVQHQAMEQGILAHQLRALLVVRLLSLAVGARP